VRTHIGSGSLPFFIDISSRASPFLHQAKSTVSRLQATPAERALRERKLCTAVRTILECIGEDPDREGLLKTPERFAQSVMWMTMGYEERLAGNLKGNKKDFIHVANSSIPSTLRRYQRCHFCGRSR
jgi:hypothetical protein